MPKKKRKGHKKKGPTPRRPSPEITAEVPAPSRHIPLRFPPPRAEWSRSPDAVAYWWGQLEYGLAINDPARFPPLPEDFTLSEWDERVLRQYIRVARLLAESTVLNSDIGVTVVFESGSETVTDTFVPDDAEAGFLARFRLLYPESAHGGFAAAVGVLKKLLKDSPEHVAELETWEEAAKQLRQRSAERLCLEKGLASGDIPPMGEIGTYPDRQKPKDTIAEYFNGEYFHWEGRKAEAIDQRREDSFEHAWEKMALLNAVTGLAYLFIGFSVIVENALGQAVVS